MIQKNYFAGAVCKHGYPYDIFVAYEEEDHQFAMEHVIPKVDSEFDGNYKCIVESRDFLPGAFKTESILEAVHQSFRIFLLLSENVHKGTTVEWIVAHVMTSAELKRHLIPIKIDSCQVSCTVYKAYL